MNVSQVLVHGTLKPDGTLELAETPSLPPGPVEVLIRNQPTRTAGSESWWAFLERSRAELLAHRYSFRQAAEIEADRIERRYKDDNRQESHRRLQRPKGDSVC